MTHAIPFVDLFCGVGGASSGAAAAGYDVVLAVDNDADALRVHKSNHPKAKHVRATLPSVAGLALPEAGTAWHLHGSPPCTKLSIANQRRDPEQKASGLALVQWYLEYALASSATSWTMEQVGTPAVRSLLAEVASQPGGRGRVDWTVIDMCKFGVPQVRKRLIAGSPRLIAKLRSLPPRARSARDVLSAPRGTHIRGTTVWSSWGRIGTQKEQDRAGKRAVRFVEGQKLPAGYHRGGPNGEHAYRHFGPDECCHSIDGAVNCVTAGSPLKWATPHTDTQLQVLTPAEMAQLQCFPATYKLDRRVCAARRGIGNALPPIIMHRLLADADPLCPPSASPLSPSLAPNVRRFRT